MQTYELYQQHPSHLPTRRTPEAEANLPAAPLLYPSAAARVAVRPSHTYRRSLTHCLPLPLRLSRTVGCNSSGGNACGNTAHNIKRRRALPYAAGAAGKADGALHACRAAGRLNTPAPPPPTYPAYLLAYLPPTCHYPTTTYTTTPHLPHPTTTPHTCLPTTTTPAPTRATPHTR